MARPADGDPQNRPIPQSGERTFDQDLKETLTKNIQQLQGLDEEVQALDEKLQEGSFGGSGSPEALDRLSTEVDELESRLDALEEKKRVFNLADGPYPISLSSKGVVFGKESAVPPKPGVDVRGHLRARSLKGEGEYPQLELTGPSASEPATMGTRDDDALAMAADSIVTDTELVRPERSYETSLGTPQKKWLSVHAAELWIDQLVAQQTRATIGGKVFVGPTSTLADPAAGIDDFADPKPHKDQYNYIRVKHNAFSFGDVLTMEARGRVEFVRVQSRVPDGRERFPAGLTGLPNGEVTGGDWWEVTETNSVWYLDTDRSSPSGSREVAWDPDGPRVIKNSTSNPGGGES